MTLSTRRHGGSATRERPGSEVWHLMMITGLSCVRCGTLYCVEGWAAWGSYTFGYVHGRVQCASCRQPNTFQL